MMQKLRNSKYSQSKTKKNSRKSVTWSAVPDAPMITYDSTQGDFLIWGLRGLTKSLEGLI